MSLTSKKRKKTTPWKHEVKADLSNFELAKARSSLNLKIYADGEKIGELEVGRGSLYWYGRKKQKSKRIDWSKFAQMMDRLAYGEHAQAHLEYSEGLKTLTQNWRSFIGAASRL